MLAVNRGFMKMVILAHISLILVFSGILQAIGLDWVEKRLVELLTWVEFAYALLVHGRRTRYLKMDVPLGIIVFLVLYSIVHLIISQYSWVDYARGFISAFRGFAFFYACSLILDAKDIPSYFRYFRVLLIANAIICTVMYFTGNQGDHCNGLFGIGHRNAYMNVFICIMGAYATVSYLFNRMKIGSFIWINALCVYIAVLSELKFYFIEIAVIFLIVLLIRKPNRKTVVIFAIAIVIVITMPLFINAVWGSYSAALLTVAGLLDYVNTTQTVGYTFVGDLGRIGGITTINNVFFNHQPSLFGFGLGYCDYGSQFLNTHGDFHYQWFMYCITYLELGWVGLITYFVLLGSIAIVCLLQKRRIAGETEKEIVYVFVFCLMVISMILMFYNSTMRNSTNPDMLWLCISFAAVINRRTYLEEPMEAEEYGEDDEEEADEALEVAE